MPISKEEAIGECLSDTNIDLWRLRELALAERGFCNASLRRRAWRVLVGINEDLPVQYEFKPDGSGKPCDSEREQVLRDVTRSSWHALSPSLRKRWRRTMKNETDDENVINSIVRGKQIRLGYLINIVLRDSVDLHYYQGYHDIAGVILSSLVPEHYLTEENEINNLLQTRTSEVDISFPSALLLKISKSHLRDPMKTDFSSLIATLHIVIFPLIQFFDVPIHNQLRESKVEPYFALSWVLTWFSHDVRDTEVAARLFDAFLSAHPLFPFYMSVAMILHPVNRHELLKTECEFSILHQTLSALPKKSCSVGWKFEGGYVSDDGEDTEDQRSKQTVPIQELIDMAISYMRKVPPRHLIPLARTYNKGELKPYIIASHSISLFKHPPAWALRSSANTDSMRYQICERKENSNSQQLKERKKQLNKISHYGENNQKKENCNDAKGVNPSKFAPNAVVAAGIGPDPTPIYRNKMLIIGGLTIVVLSIGWGLLKMSQDPDSKPFKWLHECRRSEQSLDKMSNPDGSCSSRHESVFQDDRDPRKAEKCARSGFAGGIFIMNNIFRRSNAFVKEALTNDAELMLSLS